MNYTGNKLIYGVYHKIINEIPQHNTYYELFAGGGAIGKLLIRSIQDHTVKYIFNDIDKKVTDEYFYQEIQPLITVSAETQSLMSVGSTNPEIQSKMIVSANRIRIFNRTALDIIQTELSVRAQNNNFVFLDPPYLHSTRPNQINLYRYEMTDKDHIQLLTAVRTCKAKIMIIHPRCELYDTTLQDWRQIDVKLRYSTKTSEECIYMNYDKPKILQCDKFLGSDCWDRQRIKRKGERFIKKFLNLPALERKYIMDRLNNAV